MDNEVKNEDTQLHENEEKTFTQEELNKVISERVNKEKAKMESYTKRIEELEAKIKALNENTEKFNSIIDNLTIENNSLKTETLKNKVLAENNLPQNAIEFLNGENEEELQKQAEKLSEMIKPSQPLAQAERKSSDNGYKELLNNLNL